MSVLDHALAAAGRGWKVFPVEPDGKRPLVKAWEQVATDDVGTIWGWFEQWPEANYGVACGPSGLLVVDVDVKGEGYETLDRLKAEGLCPDTLAVATPSGGRHLFYAGAGRSTSRSLGDGIDTRGAGGYVVGPGSRIDGKEYAAGPDTPIAAAPGHLLLKLRDKLERREGAGGVGVLDTPANLARARSFLQGADPATEGGRSHEVYRNAAVVRDFGISEESCCELLHEYNARCSPPLPDDELEFTVGNVYKYAKREIGERAANADTLERLALAAADLLKLKTEPDPRRPADRFRVMSWADVQAMPDPEWLVEGALVEQSLAMIYGPWSSYKSFIAISMALSVAAGIDWCGRKTRKAPTLYVAGEGAAGLKKRVAAWSAAHPSADVSGFGVVTSMPMFGDDDDLRAFAEAAVGHKPGLIVVDTFAHAMAGLDENAQKDSGLFVARAVEMGKALGAAVLVIHHMGKDESKGARGSTVLPAACDTVFETRSPRDREVLLAMRKQKDAEAWQEPLGLAATEVEGSLVFQPAKVTAGQEDMVSEAYVQAALRVLTTWDKALMPMDRSALASAIAADLGIENTRPIRDFLRRSAGKDRQLALHVAMRDDKNVPTHWTYLTDPS